MFGGTSSYAYYGGGGARREIAGPGIVTDGSLYGGGASGGGYQGSRRDSVGSEEASGGGAVRSRRTPGQLEPPCLPVTIAKLLRSLDRNGSCRLLKNVSENGPVSLVGWPLKSGVRLAAGESEFQLCDGTGIATVRVLMGTGDTEEWLLQRLRGWLAPEKPQLSDQAPHNDRSSDNEDDGAKDAENSPAQKEHRLPHLERRLHGVYLRVVGPAFQEEPPRGPVVLRAVHIREAAGEEAAFFHVLDLSWTHLRLEGRLGKRLGVETADEKELRRRDPSSDDTTDRSAVERSGATGVVAESAEGDAKDISKSCLGSEMVLPGVLANVRDKVERAVLQYILKNRRAPIGVPKNTLIEALVRFEAAGDESSVFKAIQSLEDAAFIMDTEDENIDVVLDDDNDCGA